MGYIALSLGQPESVQARARTLPSRNAGVCCLFQLRQVLFDTVLLSVIVLYYSFFKTNPHFVMDCAQASPYST